MKMNNKKEDAFDNIIEQLNELKEEDENEWQDDVIKRTISKLLSIEKKAMYGSLRGKAKEMDKIILAEIKNIKENQGDTKKNSA